MDPYIQRKIIKKKGTSFEKVNDFIAVEKKLKIFVNNKELINLYCTPSMIKELVVIFHRGDLGNKISSTDRLVNGKETGTFC
jgi:formate dehydrogenase assembly factor FdhD